MHIFNSLGSNYDFSFAISSLFASNNKKHTRNLVNYLENVYTGNAILTYKGREAIDLSLQLLNLPKGSVIAISGYTCFVVYKAIKNAGHVPIYLDIDKDNLNFSFEEFNKKLKQHPNIKVLIVQNTLGYPCDIEKFSKLCREKNIILIEDLAHSAGANYEPNNRTGSYGDFLIFSFSQDKIIDSISGGALVIRNKKYINIEQELSFESISSSQQVIDRIYPFTTFLIRKTYGVLYLGKTIHKISKKINILSSPLKSITSTSLKNLPHWYASLAMKSFSNLDKNIAHRRKIATIYSSQLNPKILIKGLTEKIDFSTNLRFPIYIEHREKLINYLTKHRINISDIWYDAPIAPGKYLFQTDYNHSCPVSEYVSTVMLNLPTHKNISEKDAINISEKINTWLKSQ